MKPFVNEIQGLSLPEAFLNVKHMPYSLLLDSADLNHPSGRYSFIACQPIETIRAKDGHITITNWEQRLNVSGDPFDILSERMKSWIKQTENHPNLPPFQGGAAGLFSYDLGRTLERIPERAPKTSTIADMDIGIYDQVVAQDHLLKKTYIFTHARNESEAQVKREHLLNMLLQKREAPSFLPADLEWFTNFERSDYLKAIQTVINYIRAGDIFQANIAQRFNADLPDSFDPYLHYLNLREINPAPFAAYMNLGEIKISSASPERFLTVRGNRVETCPIKGTRPRFDNVAQDRASKAALQNSEKDRAENTMIVDLMRNDLSKVCEPSSVDVADLCKLESFAGVHHLVSTIRATLRPNKTALDTLRACFPGGSITGAPKIRAMEIIEEIENARRGAYCGSIGYIGFDGAMDSNILIRTLTYEKNNVCLQAGGGIVADSNPEEEYNETFDKAEKIFNSFEKTAGEDEKSHSIAS